MFSRLEVIVLTNKQANKQMLPKTSNVLRYAMTLGKSKVEITKQTGAVTSRLNRKCSTVTYLSSGLKSGCEWRHIEQFDAKHNALKLTPGFCAMTLRDIWLTSHITAG